MSITNAMSYAMIIGVLLAYLAILVSPKESITFKVFIYTNKIT